jgi:alkanesulfonate monooxygenase SsuD/methylene tetrahydromethanopterin reductase-like flavin-dependent oxidoreductase (luciferase family)
MTDMRFGFVLPGGSASEQLELAVLADGSGWDGLFVWEGGYVVDAWSLLTAMAMRTTRVRLGTMLTPLPWRRPWKLAGQVATLDQLSDGRAILAVGLGAVDTGLGSYGEVTEKSVRAELLDEGIDLIDALWSGGKTFEGNRYTVDISTAMYEGPKPVQQPRPPIWVVGAKDRQKSMQRVVRCDGILPTTMAEDGARQSTPEELVEMLNWLDDHGGRRPGFDVVVEGETRPGDASAVLPYVEAGATWWLETRWGPSSPMTVRERIEAGPPAT